VKVKLLGQLQRWRRVRDLHAESLKTARNADLRVSDRRPTSHIIIKPYNKLWLSMRVASERNSHYGSSSFNVVVDALILEASHSFAQFLLLHFSKGRLYKLPRFLRARLGIKRGGSPGDDRTRRGGAVGLTNNKTEPPRYGENSLLQRQLKSSASGRPHACSSHSHHARARSHGCFSLLQGRGPSDDPKTGRPCTTGGSDRRRRYTIVTAGSTLPGDSECCLLLERHVMCAFPPAEQAVDRRAEHSR
jgi:hypothetical protein